MKILEIIPDLEKRAGAEVFFYSLCKELAKDNSLKVVVVIIWNLIDPSFLDLMTNRNIKFYCCEKNKKGINLKVLKLFKTIIKNEKPDIVHTHRSVLLTYFLSFGFRKASWKYYHTVHNVANKEAGLYERFLRKIYVRRKLIYHIGISDEISKSIFRLYKEKAVSTIYNGIDFRTSISSQKMYDFVCVARFSKQKNHMFLLSSFAELLKQYPKTKLLLVGDGELMDKCKDYCLEMGIFHNVVFYGATSSVESLLGQSKIFVLSSLYEGNPISILEAMSSGLPIIAPRVGGIPDVISQHENGILYDANQKDQLVSAMSILLDNQTLLRDMSKNNICKSKDYSIKKCAKAYVQTFRND